MNLVTAVIVSGAFERVDEDKEVLRITELSKKKKLIRKLRKMFQRLDADASGLISLDELDCLTEEDRHLLQSSLTTSDPVEIFSALDVDETGALEIDELCDGIWSLSISQTPLEMKRIEKQVEAMREQMRTGRDMQGAIMHTIDRMNATLTDLSPIIRPSF